METIDDFIKEQMQDPAFAKAWEETEQEMNVICAIVDQSKHKTPRNECCRGFIKFLSDGSGKEVERPAGSGTT